MDKQLIISIGREFASGGHEIAEKLSKLYNLPLYDHNLLDSIATERNLSIEELGKYDEKPKNKFFSRTVKGHSNSPQENVAKMQFNYIKQMADEGKSFVVVGRCSEMVLKESEALVSIFVLGDIPTKIQRLKTLFGMTEAEAKKKMEKKDAKRKAYHNGYCKIKWGDSRNYDISVNSSKLGIDGTVDMLKAYIDMRLSQR